MGPNDVEPLWIITGAAGFLGNTLVRALLERGRRVRACIIETETPESLAGLACEVVRMDVTDRASVAAAFAHESGARAFVVHCAGMVSIVGKVSPLLRRVNVEGTANVVAACRVTGVERLAYISTVHAIPEPEEATATIRELDDPSGFDPDLVVGAYARTKAEATAAVLAATHLWRVVIHPSGLIGPFDFGDTHMTRLVRDASDGNLAVIVSGGYDFVDVRDVAEGIVAAVLRGTNGHCYILSNRYFAVTDLVREVCRLAGRRRPPVKVPLWLARAIAPAAGLVARIRGVAPLFTSYSLRTLYSPSDFSHQRATTELGYEPRPMSETLADTVAWLAVRKAARR